MTKTTIASLILPALRAAAPAGYQLVEEFDEFENCVTIIVTPPDAPARSITTIGQTEALMRTFRGEGYRCQGSTICSNRVPYPVDVCKPCIDRDFPF